MTKLRRTTQDIQQEDRDGEKKPSPSDNFVAKKCYITASLLGGANTTLGMTLFMR